MLRQRWFFAFDKEAMRQRYRDRLLANAKRRADRRREAREQSGMVTRREFAIMARISERTIQRLRGQDGFPTEYAPTPRRRTYRRDDVEAWIASRPLW